MPEWTVNQLIDKGEYNEAVIRMEGQLMSSLQLPVEAYERLPETVLYKSPLLLKHYARLLSWGGELLRAKTMLEAALKGFAVQSLQDLLLSTFADLAIVNIRHGNADEAAAILHFLRDEYEKRGSGQSGEIPFVLGFGSHLLNAGDSAKVYYLAALERVRDQGDWPSYYGSLFEYLADHAGEADEAEWSAYFALFFQGSNSYFPVDSGSVFLRVLRAFHQDGWDEIVRLADPPAGMDDLPARYRSMTRLLRTHAQMMLGQSNDPLRAIDISPSVDKEEDGSVRLLQVCLWTEWAFRRGDRDQAVSGLTQARALMNPCHKPWLRDMADRLESRIVDCHDTDPNVPLSSGWKINCFGSLRFQRDGMSVDQLRPHRKKSLELLAYLLLRPRLTGSKEQVAEDLFTDLDPEKMMNQLYVIVHDLRKTLAEHLDGATAIAVKDGFIRLDEAFIEMVDVERYSTLARVGEQLWSDAKEIAVEMMEKACELYDELLPELPYAEWLDRFRESLLERQVVMLHRLGGYAAGLSDYDRAEIRYREWIRLRPQQEEAYQELIRLLVQTGRKAEAERVYHILDRLCREELGTTPVPETTRLLTG